VSLAYRTTSAPVGITNRNPAIHRPACTKLAKPPLLAPVVIPSAGVVDLEGVSPSDGLVLSSLSASEEGGTGAAASSDSTTVRVKLSVVLPNAWCIEKFAFGSADSGGVRLNAQMMCCMPSGGACAAER
jgi:hypothetical protein